MAKSTDVRATIARNTTIVATNPDLSSKVLRAIEEIKKPFTSFTKDFAAIAMRREELAPKFMKAFGLWQAETGGNFVTFIRHLDPSVGNTRNEYRTHRSYQAADYLRRIVANVGRREGAGGIEADVTGPVTPAEAFSRLLAAFMKLIPDSQINHLREAMQESLHWDLKRVDRSLEQATEAEPIVSIKGKTIDNLKLSTPEPADVAA